LGSLECWEEDKRQHRENLLSELEAQYVADLDAALDVAAEDSICRAALGLPGGLDLPAFERELEQSTRSDPGESIGARGEASCVHVPLGLEDEMLARLREEDEIARSRDEARIAQLRAEVEDMRIRAEGGPDSSFVISPYAAALNLGQRSLHHPDTPHPGLVLDASLSGLDTTLGLQAWREEVDAVLGDQLFDDELEAVNFDVQNPSTRGLALMEGQLLGARERVRMMEDAVESAHACAEDELGELDQLLSECEELHAKLMKQSVEEQQ
jgi:hypothetical protein